MNAYSTVAPDATKPAPEPRARIIAALHRRGEGGAAEQPASDLSALASDLPADDTRAPQDRFNRDVQCAFLEALSIVGSVRHAARRVGVSHMTAYRARRRCAAFRRCWDAAVVLAIPHAEEELTCRAIDGVEEDVMYRGEVVHTRIRKDSRLLLAHLGRLDKKAAQPQAAALAECFDDALEALGRGEDLPETAPETPEAVLPPGQCNRCNTSPAQGGMEETIEAAAPTDFAPAELDDTEDETGPCCVNPDPRDCALCPHYPEEFRLIERMAEARPADAPDFDAMGQGFDAEQCQIKALVAGDRNWWRYGPDFELWEKDAGGIWRPEREIPLKEEGADRGDADRSDVGEEFAGDDHRPHENGPRAELAMPAEPAGDFVRGPRVTVI